MKSLIQHKCSELDTRLAWYDLYLRNSYPIFMTPEEMYSFLTKNCYFFAEVKCGIVGYCYLVSVFWKVMHLREVLPRRALKIYAIIPECWGSPGGHRVKGFWPKWSENLKLLLTAACSSLNELASCDVLNTIINHIGLLLNDLKRC